MFHELMMRSLLSQGVNVNVNNCGGPAAVVAGLIARLLPLRELAHGVAQLGCDHILRRHVPLRVRSVPVAGGVNVLVVTAIQSYIRTYKAHCEVDT